MQRKCINHIKHIFICRYIHNNYVTIFFLVKTYVHIPTKYTILPIRYLYLFVTINNKKKETHISVSAPFQYSPDATYISCSSPLQSCRSSSCQNRSRWSPSPNRTSRNGCLPGLLGLVQAGRSLDCLEAGPSDQNRSTAKTIRTLYLIVTRLFGIRTKLLLLMPVNK